MQVDVATVASDVRVKITTDRGPCGTELILHALATSQHAATILVDLALTALGVLHRDTFTSATLESGAVGTRWRSGRNAPVIVEMQSLGGIREKSQTRNHLLPSVSQRGRLGVLSTRNCSH